MFYLIFCLFLLPALVLNKPHGQEKLIFVNAVWRHGARSPLHSFPTDPNDPSVWPQGPGQLTQVGMRMQYELGKYLKARYSDLLSASYERSEVYVRSTDVDRTLMSAESNMAGMYPPNGKQKWNGTNTSWQPIPIHTVSLSEDKLLRFPSNSTEYGKIMKKIWSSSRLQKLEAENKEFLEDIRKFTGIKEELTIQNSYRVCDTLVCEKYQNLTLPDWLTAERFQRLKNISTFQMGTMFGKDTEYITKIAQLGAGALIQKILTNMDMKINNTAPYKLIDYSAHDTTLAGLLVPLKAFIKHPIFASCVMFELYEQSLGPGSVSHFVRAYYRTSPTEEPVKLTLLDCTADCPLETLKKQAASLFPQKTPTPTVVPSSFSKKYFVLALVILVVVLLAVVVRAICTRHRNKRATGRKYQALQDGESLVVDPY